MGCAFFEKKSVLLHGEMIIIPERKKNHREAPINSIIASNKEKFILASV